VLYIGLITRWLITHLSIPEIKLKSLIKTVLFYLETAINKKNINKTRKHLLKVVPTTLAIGPFLV